MLGCCLTALLISVGSVQAQYAQYLGTNRYNFFATNSNNGNFDGSLQFPNVPFGGTPGTLNYFSGSDSGDIPPSGSVTIPASSVTGSATFTLGINPTGAGTVLTLTNLTSSPEEVRLDWAATYQNTGSTGPLPAFIVNVLGTNVNVTSYWELAGGLTLYYNNTTYPLAMGGTANLFNPPGPAGPGPWIGLSGGPANINYTGPYMTFGVNITHNDTFAVYGYLDVIVDPGAIQVQIQAAQPPALGICTYSNSPVVFFPTIPGTNFVLQMSTNLASTNWVTVTNGVPFSGVEITNAPSPAFFRLQ